VIDAEGYDGEPVSNVTFEEKTTERYSTDIQELNTQLDKLAEYQQEIQEDRDALIEEEATGGGWGRLLRRRRAPARSPPFSALSESRTRSSDRRVAEDGQPVRAVSVDHQLRTRADPQNRLRDRRRRIVMVAPRLRPDRASPWVGSSRRSGRSFRGSEMRRILIFVLR